MYAEDVASYLKIIESQMKDCLAECDKRDDPVHKRIDGLVRTVENLRTMVSDFMRAEYGIYDE